MRYKIININSLISFSYDQIPSDSCLDLIINAFCCKVLRHGGGVTGVSVAVAVRRRDATKRYMPLTWVLRNFAVVEMVTTPAAAIALTTNR